MIHNFENTESWEDKAGNTQKLGNSKLGGFDPTPSINYNVYPFESFTLSPFEKMLGSWYPEFVHNHVFMGIHGNINNNHEDSKY